MEQTVVIRWKVLEALLADPSNRAIVQEIREECEKQLPEKFGLPR